VNPPPDTGRLRSFYLEQDGTGRNGLTVDEVNQLISTHSGHLWVDIDTTVPEQAEALKHIHGLHPLAVEDALCEQSRAKLEEYPHCLFVVIIGVRFHEGTPDPYDLQTYSLSCFLGSNVLVTAHAGPSEPVDDVARRIERNPELLSHGIDRLTHAIMDGSIDDYFPLLDRIDDFVDDLEQRVIINFDENSLKDVFAVKRLVLALRRHVAPQREVFNIMTNRPSALLSPDSQIYFRDIYDHVLRINDSIDSYRELLGSVLDSYLTQVSNRMGRVTKGLAVVATVSIPFVVVSGMWGMNFQHIPLSGHPNAFWWMLAIQVVLGVVLLVILRIWKLL
jgi:magnesium transporter